MQRLWVGILLLLWTGVAAAYEPPNRDQLWYTNAFFGRVNPLGAIDYFKVGYKRRLEIGDTALGRDAYVFAGAQVSASPAFARAGVFFEAEPTGLLQFGALYQYGYYFGTFDQIASFSSTDEVFADSFLKRLSGDGQTGPRSGHVVNAWIQPKFKLGFFAVRDTLTMIWQQLDLPAGEIAFYDQIVDRMAPNGGFMLTNDADVMFFWDDNGLVGLRYTYSASFFDGSETGPGALPHHRIGPLLAYTFFDHKERARFDRPTLFALVQWWLQHPYRG
ncbi:MAG: hypothetical protein KC656_07425, partial [Myxococcales bacterium]|nr:hypothetical protein [Myxococcales bacterium]